MTKWTLAEGVNIIQDLDPLLRKVGIVCALTGSVIFKGESTKDLDIILYPYDDRILAFSPAKLEEVLVSFGFKRTQGMSVEELRYPKEIQIWEFNGKRVDFIFLGVDELV